MEIIVKLLILNIYIAQGKFLNGNYYNVYKDRYKYSTAVLDNDSAAPRTDPARPKVLHGTTHQRQKTTRDSKDAAFGRQEGQSASLHKTVTKVTTPSGHQILMPSSNEHTTVLLGHQRDKVLPGHQHFITLPGHQVTVHSGHPQATQHPQPQPGHQEDTARPGHQHVAKHLGHQEVRVHPGYQEDTTYFSPQEHSITKEYVNNKILKITVKSGELSALVHTNFSAFTVNDQKPDIEEAATNNAGLYVIVLHQATGLPLCTPFNLQPWADFHLLKPFIESLQHGRIIIFMLRRDLAFGLPPEVRSFLQLKGSAAAGFVGPGMTWVWVWVKGGRTLAEAVTFPGQEKMAPRNIITIYMPLSQPEDYCAQWPRGKHWDLRRQFCDKYEQYGDFCSCSNPDTFVDDQNLIVNNQIKNAVIVMLAHRVPSLYRSMKSLSRARGFNRSRFETYTMTRSPQLARFLELLDLPLTATYQTHAMLSTAIARHSIFAIDHALRTHPDAQFVIVLEEDVQVSPDFFVFLNKTAPLLLEDPSLYCVSAHNDLSYPQTSYDPRAVLRTESYPNYGWMVKRSFAEEMVSSLYGIDEEYDWDVVTYYYLRRGRECIIPEVSRSLHFAHDGAHISQVSVRRYFSNKNLNEDPEAFVEGVDLRLYRDNYEATLVSMLERAKFLQLPEETPCQRDFFKKITVRENDVLVLFFRLDEDIKRFRNNVVWETLAHCLNIFGIESREGHQGLYRLRYGPAHFLLVAHPASPYSHYKPAEVSVFSASPEEVLFARNATAIHEELNPLPYDMDHFLETDIPLNRNKT